MQAKTKIILACAAVSMGAIFAAGVHWIMRERARNRAEHIRELRASYLSLCETIQRNGSASSLDPNAIIAFVGGDNLLTDKDHENCAPRPIIMERAKKLGLVE